MPAVSEPVPAGWIVRLYAHGEDPSAMPPFVAVCYLQPHESEPAAAWIKGLHGSVTRALLADLARECQRLGIGTLLSVRGEGHGVPGARPDEHGVYRSDLTRMLRRAR